MIPAIGTLLLHDGPSTAPIPRPNSDINHTPDPSSESPSPTEAVPVVTEGSATQMTGRTAIDTSGTEDDITGAYTDLANQQAGANTASVDTDQMNNDVASVSDIKSGNEYTSNDPSVFVENRLADMMDNPDNRLKKHFDAIGRAAVNRTGLLSTSGGQGAVVGNTIGELRKIATSDAQMQGKFDLAQQGAENKIEGYKAEGAVSGTMNEQEARQNNFNNSFKIALNGLDKATQTRMTAIKTQWEQDFQAATQELDARLQVYQKNHDLSVAELADIRDKTSQIVMNHQVSVENLLGNSEFMQMPAKAVNAVLNNLKTGMEGSVQYVMQQSGINDYIQSGYINNLSDAFTFTLSTTEKTTEKTTEE